MIKITIELFPLGFKEFKRTLHEINIINNLSCKNRLEYGNYNIIIDKVRHTNILKNFERKKGVLKLLRDVLNNMDLDIIPNQDCQK